MRIAIVANDDQREALTKNGFAAGTEVTWMTGSPEAADVKDVDALVHLLFNDEVLPAISIPMIVHSPIRTLTALHANGMVARCCAWNGFSERRLWELAVADGASHAWLQELMAALNIGYRMVQDEPGLVAPRVVSMIINEAYFGLSEGISTQEEIDTAMRLGTNYPYGPFEWASKIGLANVHALLTRLAADDDRYQPCDLITRSL